MNEKTFFCIRPQFFRKREVIKRIIKKSGLCIVKTKVVWLTESDVEVLYGREKPSCYFDLSLKYMTGGFSEVGVVEGERAITRLSNLTGNTHIPEDCANDTLRRMFGKKYPVRSGGFDYYLNPLHRSRDKSEATRELNLFRILDDRPLNVTVSNIVQKLYSDRNFQCVFDHHIKVVVALGNDFCKRFGGDKDVVELACWLHDISSVKNGTKSNHHIMGAEEAGHILRVLGQKDKLITQVQECVRSHRGSAIVKHMSKEAEIVCASDGIANLCCPPLLFFFAFNIKKLDFVDGVQSIREKVLSSFRKIPGFAKADALKHLSWWEKLELKI